MAACSKGQAYLVRRIEVKDGGFLIHTEERAVFGALQTPVFAAGDTVALGATCAGWTQLLADGERLRARVLKEPEVDPVTIGLD